LLIRYTGLNVGHVEYGRVRIRVVLDGRQW